MKTKEQKNNINVITLGCSKNTYDSEILMGQLKNNGAVVNHESDDESSDIVIINTCGFIENAKQESLQVSLHREVFHHIYISGVMLAYPEMVLLAFFEDGNKPIGCPNKT